MINRFVSVSAAGCALVAAAFSAGETGKPPAKQTFTEHIAPIVFNNCTSCHRPGEAAPFALMSYQDVRKRGALIATVTRSRYMPPWHAEPGYGDFIGVHRLTDQQIASIQQWVEAGMPEGDPAKLPALPKFTEGWQLGTPDMVLTMTEPFELPASGPDIYRNFTIPMNIPQNKWVKAVEFRPSARKVVHHALFFLDNTGESRKHDGEGGQPGYNGGLDGTRFAKSGRLGGWAVGANPHILPAGLALPLQKGSDFVIQAHFHLSGKAEKEQSTIGLYFADRAPERMLTGIQVPAIFGVGMGLDIPAGEKSYTIRDSFTLPVDVEGLAVGGHAHYLAKDMQAVATLPDGSKQWLLWIKDWDFSWQDQYQYKRPMALPKGTRIDVAITYDNSADNPRNPSHPPKRVKWGEQSFDEMGSVTVQVAPARQSDFATLMAALQEKRVEAIRNAYKNRAGSALGFARPRR
jgi:mono/diheme cytochrome c family protein